LRIGKDTTPDVIRLRNIRVESVYPMIIKMANEHFRGMSDDNRAEIIQEGAMGAMIAAERYDEHHEPAAMFATFARFWIAYKMMRAARKLCSPRLAPMHDNEAQAGACERSARAFRTVESNVDYARVRPLMAKCKPLEVAVLIRHVAHGESMRSIGEVHGVSRQYVNQVKIAALERMREELAC
jgi:RNA polymerase sigma factor (sigma-70 family)